MRGTAIHGDTPFDVPFISPIEPMLFQGGCKNGLVLPTEVRHLVSLYPWERYTIMRQNMSSELYVEMYDDLAGPGLEQIIALGNWVNVCRESGVTLVHCQAGLNRSALICASALMLGDGLSADEAVSLLRERRSPAVLCNRKFVSFLRNELTDAIGRVAA